MARKSTKMAVVRKLSEIAHEIRVDWFWRPSHPAFPYLRAMGQLETLEDKYGADSACSVVRYFLANAATWTGPTARRVKVELQEMLTAAQNQK